MHPLKPDLADGLIREVDGAAKVDAACGNAENASAAGVVAAIALVRACMENFYAWHFVGCTDSLNLLSGFVCAGVSPEAKTTQAVESLLQRKSPSLARP